jgi:tetratricopeptide (TPR) repeat protein
MARAALRQWVPAHEGISLLERAVADLDESVRLRPHAGETLFHRAEIGAELARLYHARGRWGDERRLRLQSAEDHGRVRHMRPDWLLPILLQAAEYTALARLGDEPGDRLREAIDNASAVLTREPRNAQAALVRADARLAAACRFGDADDERARLVWKQAEADFESATAMVGLRNREEVHAVFAQAQATWADVLSHTGAPEEARQLWMAALTGLERAVDDDPRDPGRLLARADVLLHLAALAPDAAGERRQQALGDIQAVLEQDPESAAAFALRAVARLETGTDAADVLGDVGRARRLAPEDGRILASERRVLLRLAASATGDDRAMLLHQLLENCAASLRLRPDDARTHLDQARALHLAGRAQAAYAALEQALRLAPGLRHAVRSDPVWADVAHGDGFRRLVGAD